MDVWWEFLSEFMKYELSKYVNSKKVDKFFIYLNGCIHIHIQESCVWVELKEIICVFKFAFVV